MSHPALKWLLILGITGVSTSMLMFLSQFIAITAEASAYYDVQESKLLYFYNSFNVCTLIFSPILFGIIKKYYFQLVTSSIILNCFGIIGRDYVGNHFGLALLMTTLVAIAHVPIISAPYGLLKLFQPSYQGYAATIPLFLPVLGISYVILHGLIFIVSDSVNEISDRFPYIHGLNIVLIIFTLAVSIPTLILMSSLKEEINQINKEQPGESKGILTAIKLDLHRICSSLAFFVGWGAILGINWTYGGMFDYFLAPTGLTEKQMAVIGLFANLSTAIFSSMGTYISNNTSLSNSIIIFCLNITGFFASLFIQCSTSLYYPFFQNKINIIIAIIILRAGFSAFANLALIELSKNGINPLVSSMIFFYIANVVNLFGNELTGLVQGKISLGILSFLIWLNLIMINYKQQKQSKLKKQHKTQSTTMELQMDSSEVIDRDFQQQQQQQQQPELQTEE